MEDRIPFEVRTKPPPGPPRNLISRVLYGISWGTAKGVQWVAERIAEKVFGRHEESPAEILVVEHNDKSTILWLPMGGSSTIRGEAHTDEITVCKGCDCDDVITYRAGVIRDGPLLKTFDGNSVVRHGLRRTKVFVSGEVFVSWEEPKEI